jgi:LCP family protein required for cell wall assembly
MTYSGSNYRGAASVPSGDEPVGAAVAKAPKGPTRRGLIGSAVGLAASVAAAGAGTTLWTYTDSTNDNLDRAFDLDDLPDRPEKTVSGAMNFLVLGSDARGDDEDGRSDTAILMHVNAAGDAAYGISIPRDLWVYMPPNPNAMFSDTHAKFNAAYSWGGAEYTVQTLESYTGVRIDHIVEINFPGLVQVVDALGGVYIEVEQEITSIHKPYRTFEQGTNLMTGEEALDYVRQRKQFADGDFQRMRNQQKLIMGIMDAAVSAGVVTSPSTVTEFVKSVSDAIKVDTGFNVVATAIQFMHLRSSNITFLTSPNAGTGWQGDQSVVLSDDERAATLYDAVDHDVVDQWIRENPDSVNDES